MIIVIYNDLVIIICARVNKNVKRRTSFI